MLLALCNHSKAEPGDEDVLMAKVLYHVTMSLDGFIAARDDDMSWLRHLHGAPNPIVAQVMADIGALLIGHRTYHGGAGGAGAKTAQGKPYGGAIQVPMFVLTRDDPRTAVPGYTFIAGDVTEAVRAAAATAGDRYVAVLGAATARHCLEAGILDEILVHLAPVLLGSGTRLFDRPGGAPVGLELIEASQAGSITNLWLRVSPAEPA